MKYIIFVVLLVYVAAHPSIIDLKDHVKTFDEEINELSNVVLNRISALEDETAVGILLNQRKSFDEIVDNYINNIPKDQSLQFFRDFVREHIPKEVFSKLYPWRPGCKSARNYGELFILAAKGLLKVPSDVAQERWSNSSPEIQILMNESTIQAEYTAYKAIIDLLQALSDASNNTSPITAE